MSSRPFSIRIRLAISPSEGEGAFGLPGKKPAVPGAVLTIDGVRSALLGEAAASVYCVRDGLVADEGEEDAVAEAGRASGKACVSATLAWEGRETGATATELLALSAI